MPINKIAHSSFEVERENYINILRSGHSIADTGWATYSDSAGVNPVDGIGGSPSITWSQNTSSPLSGDADLRLVKDAVNRQGNGVSIPFTIANRHLGKVLQITCDMELISGTYASGDLRVSIIQDPTGTPVVLEPVGTSLELGIANQRMREIATFQSHISITSYRLCIHVSSTSASAYTVDFANFKVWEPTQSVGAVITDWQSYTPTIVGCGTVSTVDFRWRRVGSSMEIFGSFRAGTTTAVPIQIPLPNGLFPNLPNSANQTRNSVGIGTRAEYSSTVNSYNVIADNSLNYLTFGYLNAGSLSYDPLATFNCSSVFNTNDDILVRAEVPIQGWGSSVAMSSDTGDGRLIGGSVSGHTSRAYTTDVTVIRTNTVIKDSHSSYNTGVITIPISGDYVFGFNFFYLSVGSQANIKVFKNGSFTGLYLGQFSSSYASSQSVKIDNLRAGDTIDFRISSDVSIPSDTGMLIWWHRISAGSQVIATTETVACSYYSAANQTSFTTQINFGGVIYDTHGAVTIGSSWKFTAPMSGKYLITYHLGASTTSNQYIEVWKNGSLYRRNITGGINSASFQLHLLAGEYFDLRPNTSMTVSGSSSNDGNRSFIEIARIGN